MWSSLYPPHTRTNSFVLSIERAKKKILHTRSMDNDVLFFGPSIGCRCVCLILSMAENLITYENRTHSRRSAHIAPKDETKWKLKRTTYYILHVQNEKKVLLIYYQDLRSGGGGGGWQRRKISPFLLLEPPRERENESRKKVFYQNKSWTKTTLKTLSLLFYSISIG